jgi:hypothetical protein
MNNRAGLERCRVKKHDYVWGLFFLFTGVSACVMAQKLKIGSVREPGAGLVPCGAAALLGLMSLGLILKTLLKKRSARHDSEAVLKGLAWGRMAAVLCALVVYGLALEVLGFHICTFLLMVVLLGAIGRRKWWSTFTISLLTVICVYAIFEAWLGCPFPKGVIGL